MSFFVLVLVVVAIATWARLRRVDGRLEELARRSEEQQEEIRQLTNRLKLLTDGRAVRSAAESIRESVAEQPAAPAPPAPKPAPAPVARPAPVTPPVIPPVTPAAPPPVAAPPQPGTAPAPAVHSALPPLPEPPRVIVRPTTPPAARREEQPLGPPPESPPRVPYEPPPPPPPPSGPRFELPAFDWEQLVGVRLFSAIAGIALVLAGLLPPLLDRTRLAAAARARRHRHSHRRHAARRVRAQGGAQVPDHGECAGRRRHRDPVCDVLCRSLTMGSDPGGGRVRVARARHRDRRAAVDSPGVAFHRGAWAPRRLRHAGVAVQWRESSDSGSSPTCCSSISDWHGWRIGSDGRC